MTNVVDSEFSQGAIEGREVRGRLNLDDRNFDGFGAECAKAFAEFAGLVRSARDEHAAASERQRIHQAAPPADVASGRKQCARSVGQQHFSGFASQRSGIGVLARRMQDGRG